MDPRGFVRVLVGALGLRIPVASKAGGARVHALSSPCYCEVRLPNFPVETAPVPLIPSASPVPEPRNIAASFYLDEQALQKLLSASCLSLHSSCLEISVFTARQGSSCGLAEGALLGTLKIPVSFEWTEGIPVQIHSGWSCIGKDKSQGRCPGAELHVNIRVEADPRFMFQFDGETALSPQIVQVQGKMRQPIFSCKFSRDRSFRTRLGQPDTPRANGWSVSHQGDKDKDRKERKGWIVVIHDLSGSPVAAASMVTPFVPFTGSDRVSRSNPGAWLILRPEPTGASSWLPWGRLEAWRERGGKGKLGLKFQLIPEGGGVAGTGNGVLVSEMVIPMQKGGEFVVDTGRLKTEASPCISPVETPQSSGDCSFNLGLPIASGFVMSCKVPGERKSSKPTVQLATRHVACVEDAAVFMALAAAVDLSRDACQPFSRKLRSELSQSMEDPF
ncbi:hypothetical protein O6H91_16G022900 [Diphasiastrum complanatum]|uniref:Uncharacterized protein n=2 Tax=Diphasiastrum complanatum TaxID=34168 RepID=A0ACC2BAN2_DIPCM|nr:hypothetical protein O6H91_16G022900 [Diphasiastrum complanatum]KAJ7526778.1 hypothetical protein O6H91_16G022900 [Diphasiastrum complanatum]